MRFLLRSSKRKSSNSPSQRKVAEPFQRQLETFQPAPSPPEARRPLISEVSIKQLESEVNEYLKDFQSYVRQIKETSLSLEELTKLLKSGEIPENAYRLIAEELGKQLSISVDDIFRLREVLELAKAKAKLEWAKEKVAAPYFPPGAQKIGESQAVADLQYVRGYAEVLHSDYWTEQRKMGKPVYSMAVAKWEELISKIDAALTSLSIEEEAGIIEQYLSLIREKLSFGTGTEEVQRAMTVCQQRLGLISDRWASMRRSQIEKIMNLELEASKVKDEVKELEVRFAVGELYQEPFEQKMNQLQTSLRKVEKEINGIRESIDDMDMKLFRCSELSRENP